MVLIKPKTAYFRRFILVKPYKSLPAMAKLSNRYQQLLKLVRRT